MLNQIGLSVYVSAFEDQKPMLESFQNKNAAVFTSLHIQEEWEEGYRAKAVEMCNWLKQRGFQIIADVSPKTLTFFNKQSLPDLAHEMGLDVLRIDYGFPEEELLSLAGTYELALNASTLDPAFIKKIGTSKKGIDAMHNFYPRPETGLDEKYFSNTNQRLAAAGVKIMAFIPGDEKKRGPLFEGLPTLEKHRSIPPYVAFLDLLINFQVEAIFVGDVALSSRQRTFINNYLEDQVISVPTDLMPSCKHLYNQVFTIRADSPKRLMRLQESREYSCTGEKQEPHHCIERERGSVTMDNYRYNRYSGEIQLIRETLPGDERVNVIGRLHHGYEDILECIKNGSRIKLIE